jgi:Tfp pilus assembly pilus retraction ATPase PilT
VTGPKESGKSTTPAGIRYEISRTRKVHIFTVEHPIEQVDLESLRLIDQQEMGSIYPHSLRRFKTLWAGPLWQKIFND